MVAPHDTGDLVRSLVRVPGSGRDRTMASVCCDLSNVSSYAATVPVPQALPPAIARPLVEPQQPEINPRENGSDPKDLTSTHKRARPQPSEISRGINSVPQIDVSRDNRSSLPTLKRLRVVYLTPQQVGQRTGQPPNLSLTMSIVQMQPQQQQQQLSTIDIAQLLQERDDLRGENLALQKRLALFQQLFRDKKRLTSVVKRLGVNVAT